MDPGTGKIRVKMRDEALECRRRARQRNVSISTAGSVDAVLVARNNDRWSGVPAIERERSFDR